MIEAETAAVGDPGLRKSLLTSARQLRGDGRSKASRRLGARIKAIQSEDTPENREVLTGFDAEEGGDTGAGGDA